MWTWCHRATQNETKWKRKPAVEQTTRRRSRWSRWCRCTNEPNVHMRKRIFIESCYNISATCIWAVPGLCISLSKNFNHQLFTHQMGICYDAEVALLDCVSAPTHIYIITVRINVSVSVFAHSHLFPFPHSAPDFAIQYSLPFTHMLHEIKCHN